MAARRKQPEPGIIPPPPQDPAGPCTVVNRIRLCLEPVAPCGDPITSSYQMVSLVREMQICDSTQEQIWLMCIDTAGYVRGYIMLVQGQVDQAAIAPMDLLRVLATYNTQRFILIHNHPTGNPTPSREDDKLTERVMEVAKLAGYLMLDHIIIGAGTNAHFSYRDEGRL